MLEWQSVAYDNIPRWEQDRHSEAFVNFIRSCRKPKQTKHGLSEMVDKTVWQETCEQAEALGTVSADQAKAFFEEYFTPYKLSTNLKEQGLLTGYYIPVLEGSLTKSKDYTWPVYARPDDLKKGEPYFTHAEINAGALDGRGLEVMWLRDPVMGFFMHIQGSGRVRLPDGKMADLLYDGKNNRAYTAIGRTLIDQGELTKENVSLQSIRDWLYANPDRAQEIMESNESYVFFRRENAEQLPLGGQGVPLVPERSVAVDTSVLPYGLPVYVSTQVLGKGEKMRQFSRTLITQDTGGAIKGPLRGDIFFGQGDDAEARAGGQQFKGTWYLLVPTKREPDEQTGQTDRS